MYTELIPFIVKELRKLKNSNSELQLSNNMLLQEIKNIKKDIKQFRGPKRYFGRINCLD